ncbi:MAG: phospholipase D family protein [Xanthomonadales bacterium]|nr:phospholipase D family protein [Xanthomonadales bacterium]
MSPSVPGGPNRRCRVALSRLATALLAMALAGCALSPARRAEVDARLAQAQAHAQAGTAQSCTAAAGCAAIDSPFHEFLATQAGRHHVLPLELGSDALRIRLHLLRAARHSIDLQTYIFKPGAGSDLVLAELEAAARRGVRVRLLVDQLFSLNHPGLLANLVRVHPNLSLRVYNPTFNQARTSPGEFAAGILCCFSRFNQRMHTKLFAIDGEVGILGGRNYADTYFDLDPEFAYYDRELLVTGPVVADMVAAFDRFWAHPRAVPAQYLTDVARQLRRVAPGESAPQPQAEIDPAIHAQAARFAAEAADDALVRGRFLAPMLPVESIRFVADAPVKVGSRRPEANAVSLEIAGLVAGARRDLLIQTPYLVLDRPSRRLLRARRSEPEPPQVRVSTNSLAATDAFPVYALTWKYKKRYLRELGFQIHEMRPDPEDLERMVELAGPVRAPRNSMHGKTLVVDGHTSLVGSHNFDPRSDRFNTESALVIEDAALAARLTATIERDMAPGNAWLIARGPRGPAPFYRMGRAIERISTALPVFDLWPFRYATSYELQPACPPLARTHPQFHLCHADVGDFPGEDSFWKRVLTRLSAAFGAPLLPVL